MQSEECGHIGGNGLHDCRKCHRGGPEGFKVTNDGYDSLFHPQQPRHSTETLTEVKHQVSLACKGIEANVKKRQTDSGVKDAYTQHWIEYLLARFQQLKAEDPNRSDNDITRELEAFVTQRGNELYNPFLQLEGFDVNLDTPVELLHTVLLGIVKYAWHMTHSSLSKQQLDHFFVKLQSSSVDGLTIAPIRANYLRQYRNSLVGRQFKQVLQTSIFHLYGMIDDLHFSLWQAVGTLCALLWFPEIKNMTEYLADLKIATNNVLDLFALIDPSKIWSKIKLHILAHVHEDISRFGPIIGRSTEIFECFNAIFRFCAVLTNRRSPSHDIAMQLADQEALKQRITGGMWQQSESEWVQASSQVRDKPTDAGSATPVPEHRRQELQWCQTDALKTVNCPEHDEKSIWWPGEKVIAQSGDVCKVGFWVFASSPFTTGGIYL
ncbi:hypothetical protein A0H81_01426 [Grifola frondosa]|uniref:Uncharacterized protein n=1 Tax=Grifola frondosa TaxID=5627 RepID=A0A1C7LML5_GRIFR|nr:hypothetical protein A0H81_14215 [Grifola frondosa]OBZ66011.1 hypothetical protein A0H81_14016 [Grifola frondosa]OBZ79125.1 hypothetical protein A0H81_01426 [Grifola frondosa]